jgi:hypothetical protein
LNPRPPGPQPDALPTELHSPPSISSVGPSASLQPKSQARLARQKGFEPLTHGLEGRCSFHLSYWRESGRADLNGRPPAPKAGALPGCATPRTISINTRQSPPQPRMRHRGAATRVCRTSCAGSTDTAREPKSRKPLRARIADSRSCARRARIEVEAIARRTRLSRQRIRVDDAHAVRRASNFRRSKSRHVGQESIHDRRVIVSKNQAAIQARTLVGR